MHRRRVVWFANLALLVAVLVSGCGNDDGGTGAAGGGGTGGSIDNTGDAFLVANRIRTPDSRTLFVSSVGTLETGPLDTENALEAPGVSRARAYGGKVYVFDGESGFVTRYVVNGDRLQEDVLPGLPPGEDRARFTMTGVGVTRFTSQIIFLSLTRAYYIDLFQQRQVVVWNPTDMTITSAFPVPEFAREGFSVSGANVLSVGEFVVMPLSWIDTLGARVVETTALVVLSATEDRLVRVVEDDRCIVSRAAYVQDGQVFVMADSLGGIADLFAPAGSVPPPCLLRWRPGEPEFDASFYVDLRSVVGAPLVSGALGRGDGTFVTQVYTSDIDPLTLEPEDLLDQNLWQWAIVDVAAESVAVVEGVPPGAVSSAGWVVDDDYFVPFFNGDEGTSSLFRLDDSGGAEEQLTVTGELFQVARVR